MLKKVDTAATELNTFKFKRHEIRVVNINGEPWFVAVDVYNILFGRTTGIKASSFLKEDEFQTLMKVSVPDTLSSLFSGTRYRMAIISESGFYKMVMRSDKPEAKAFQDWVTRDVLPAIRKDGMYVRGEEKVATGEMSIEEMELRVFEYLKKKAERLETELAKTKQANIALMDELKK